MGPAKIIQVYEPAVDLKALLVIDNLAMGPAVGGIRLAPDPREAAMNLAVSRVEKAMSYKRWSIYTQRHLYMNISNYDSLCHSELPKAAKNLVFGGKPETLRLRLRVTRSQNYFQLFMTLCIVAVRGGLSAFSFGLWACLP